MIIAYVSCNENAPRHFMSIALVIHILFFFFFPKKVKLGVTGMAANPNFALPRQVESSGNIVTPNL